MSKKRKFKVKSEICWTIFEDPTEREKCFSENQIVNQAEILEFIDEDQDGEMDYSAGDILEYFQEVSPAEEILNNAKDNLNIALCGIEEEEEEYEEELSEEYYNTKSQLNLIENLLKELKND